MLVVVPWSIFWERNYLASLVPGLPAVLASPYVRGAVSGLGLVNLWLAFAELAALFASRADRQS